MAKNRIDTTRLPGTWGIDKEVSAIPEMPGARLITIVAPFLNGPSDRAFLVSRDNYKAMLGGYNLKQNTPDYGYLCVEETLKSANTVLVVRVADKTTLKNGEFKNEMIHIRTKYGTEVYNNLPISFEKGGYSDEVVLKIGNDTYNLSVDPSSDRYITKLGKVSSVYECLEFNPEAVIVEAVLQTLVATPNSGNINEEFTLTATFDIKPDKSKLVINTQDKFTQVGEISENGNSLIVKFSIKETGANKITVKYGNGTAKDVTITGN